MQLAITNKKKKAFEKLSERWNPVWAQVAQTRISRSSAPVVCEI